MTANLTRAHPPELAAAIEMTKPGQAHWARPDTVSACRECVHWRPRKVKRWVEGVEVTREALPYDVGGVLRPRPCAKATEFAGRQGPNVPHSAFACRYFEPHPNPPEERIVPRSDNKHLWNEHEAREDAA